MKKMASSIADLIVMAVIVAAVFILSYFFNVFGLLVEVFRRNQEAIFFIDEIIMVLLTVSICLAVFAWRRWRELKRESAERTKLQEELVKSAETKAETERIINRQLQSEIELRRKAELELSAFKRKHGAG